MYNSKHKNLRSAPQNPPKNPGVEYARYSTSGGWGAMNRDGWVSQPSLGLVRELASENT